jgi:hypothetical protein
LDIFSPSCSNSHLATLCGSLRRFDGRGAAP